MKTPLLRGPRTGITSGSAQDLFDSARNADAKGLAAFYTPRHWAQLLTTPLPRHRPVIVDLTCGRGDLLLGCSNKSTQHRLGCDIDGTPSPRTVGEGRGEGGGHLLISQSHFIGADLTALHPLLREVSFRADLFTLNPPWDLHWHRERLALLANSRVPAVRAAFKAIDPRLGRATIDSTVATLAIALDSCSDVGEGFLIANAATVERLILDDGAPHVALRDHIWNVATVDGNICAPSAQACGAAARRAFLSPPRGEGLGEGSDPGFRTAILYFALGHTCGVRQRIHIPAQADAQSWMSYAAGRMESIRRWQREGPEIREAYLHTDDTETLWAAVREEWLELQSERTSRLSRYNVRLDGSGIIRTHLSLFEQHSAFVDKALAAQLHEMNGKRPMQLVLQRSQRDALLAAIGEESPWKVDPQLAAAVTHAIAQYHAQRAPLYPLPEIQRLAFLDEEDEIVCKADWAPANVRFMADRSYSLATRTVTVRRQAERIGLSGEPEDIEYIGAELCILITDEHGRQWSFMEQRLCTDKVKLIGLRREGRDDKDDPEGAPARDSIDFTLQELVAHFIIPAVPDVAAVNPEGYRRNLQVLEEIESLCG